MSKTWLSVATALILVVVAVATHLARRYLLDVDLGIPTWKVTLDASGEVAVNEASFVTPRPLNFRRQRILSEEYQSSDLSPLGGKKSSLRRNLVWRRPSLIGTQPFQLAYSFYCMMGVRRPTAAMLWLTREVDSKPGEGVDLKPAQRIQSTSKEITDKANKLAPKSMPADEQVKALFDYVDGLPANPVTGAQTALDCLHKGGGDSGGKSRLLVALCRNRNIPARMICGLILEEDRKEQELHHWVEAWVPDTSAFKGHWVPLCPTYHHFGAGDFPKNYLVFAVAKDDLFPNRITDFHFTTEALHDPYEKISFSLRPGEQHVVKFLLLLPLAALIVSIYRTLIGVPTFGTFSPALVGLAFLDLKALPWGLSIFLGTVLVGWILRRFLDRYHLLLVPRTSVLLTLIVVFLLGVIMVANHYGVTTSQYISLFPLVILTHLVERFWTVETEDGTAASFKTLLGTMVVAVTISVALSPKGVSSWMFRYPETLAVVLMALLLIGRYTGYRVSELFRFRDLLQDVPPSGGTP